MLILNLFPNPFPGRKLVVACWLYLCCTCYGYAQCPDSPGDPYYVVVMDHTKSAGTYYDCTPPDPCSIWHAPGSLDASFQSLIYYPDTRRLQVAYSTLSTWEDRPACTEPTRPAAPGGQEVLDHTENVGIGNYVSSDVTDWDYRYQDQHQVSNSAAMFGAPIYWYEMSTYETEIQIYSSNSLEAIKNLIDYSNTKGKNNYDSTLTAQKSIGCWIGAGRGPDPLINYQYTIEAVWRHSELAANPTNFNPALPDCLCPAPCTGGYGALPEEQPEEPCATAPTITIQQPPTPE